MSEAPPATRARDSQAAGAAEPIRCKNCGAPVATRYCGNCSQARDVHLPSTPELIHDALEGITHSDSRLWRTLGLLWFKPGALSNEYIAGRRLSYLPPFRLYLILSVLFFFVASFSDQNFVVLAISGEHNVEVNPKGYQCDTNDLFAQLGRPAWDQRMQHLCEVSNSDRNSLNHLVVSAIPKAMFVFLPVVALLHMLFYWRPRYPYAVHCLYFLHLHAFFFSVLTAILLLHNLAASVSALRTPVAAVNGLLMWALMIYTLIAARRVFKNGWALTLAKGAALSLVYILVVALMIVILTIYASLQL